MNFQPSIAGSGELPSNELGWARPTEPIIIHWFWPDFVDASPQPNSPNRPNRPKANSLFFHFRFHDLLTKQFFLSLFLFTCRERKQSSKAQSLQTLGFLHRTYPRFVSGLFRFVVQQFLTLCFHGSAQELKKKFFLFFIFLSLDFSFNVPFGC